MGWIRKIFGIKNPFKKKKVISVICSRKPWLRFFKKNQGQATVEYLLLIVVVITLALSIGTPLGNWIGEQSRVLLGPDGYYGCLMEHGALPKGSKAASCKIASVDPLNISLNGGGGPFGGGPGGGGLDPNKDGSGDGSGDGSSSEGSSSSDGDSSSSGEDSDSEDGSDSGDSDSSSTDGDGSGVSGSSSSGQAGSGGGSSSGRGAGGGNQGSSFGADSSDVDSSDGEDSSGSIKRKGRRSRKSKGSGLDTPEHEGYKPNVQGDEEEFDEGFLGEEEEEERKKEEEEKALEEAELAALEGKGAKGEDSGSKGEGIFGPNKKKGEGPEDKPLNLMGLIRYIIIAILIILILAFLFSQVMEYQSRD